MPKSNMAISDNVQTLKAIAEHYLVHYGSNLSFTPDHSMCKICYNIYSAILRKLQSYSSDEELHLLSNDEPLLPEG